MNIYKATSDICNTTLFSLKWNKHSFGLRLAKLREAARNQRTPNKLGSWIKQKLH